MEDIEELIEELTKVRPEMLNEEALKLFNTIMAVLDERDKLIKENRKLKTKIEKQELAFLNGYTEGGYNQLNVMTSKITKKISELVVEEETGYFDNSRIIRTLQELMEDK